LADYTAQSFAVFREDLIDVTLQLATEAADNAERWMFHPSQSMMQQPDATR